MKNNKVLKISLFALPLVASFLAGCGENEQAHVHTYIEHAAKVATCEEAGNKAYYTCEGCNKIFDADKKETNLASIEIAKLSHNLTHHEEVKALDCKHQGTVEYWDCSLCNQKFSDSEAKNVITSIVGPFGDHTFIEHNAISATCLEDGNIAYSECSVCNKYFSADHKSEIEKDSWIVPKLNHDWTLEVSGTYKTSYQVGELFEKDKLIVEKVCKNDSSHNITLDNSDIELIYQNGSAFALGDTKITIKEIGSNLKTDIKVDVGKLENVITGLEKSYESTCGSGIDLTGVSATSGEVSVKYYLGKVEVDEEDLVGGNTYEAVVTSDGVDPAYAIAKATASLVVSHDYESEPNEEVVGYLNNRCTICDDVARGEDLMTTEDLDLTIEDDYGKPCAYGINAFSFSEDTSEGIEEAGHPTWLNPNEKGETITSPVIFPKVDYKLFENVMFNFKCSAKDNLYVGLKLNGKDLLTNEFHGLYPQGIIVVTYHEENDGYLNVTLRLTNVDYEKTIVVDNPRIIDGESGLQFECTFGAYRSFYLSNMFLNHTKHEGTGVEIPSKTTIGHYVDLCACGLEAGKGETLMTSSEIDLNNAYCAGVEKIGGDNTPFFKVYNNTLLWHNDANPNPIANMFLPKIEISAYKEIKLYFHYNCLWGQIGFNKDNTFGGFGDGNKDAKIELEIMKMANESYKATLSCPGKGALLDTTITDADVLSGAKSLSLYLNFGAYTEIVLESVEVEKDYVHEHIYSYLAKDVIGTSTRMNTCNICGEESQIPADTRVSQLEDVDYSKSTYGATLLSGDSYENNEESNISYSTLNGGSLKYGKTTIYRPGKLTLPCVDFSKYQKVIFPIEANAYYGLGLDLQNTPNHGWYEEAYYYHEKLIGTIEISVEEENKLSVKLVNSSKTLIDTAEYDSEVIYKGQNGLPFYANIPEANDYVLIGRPNLFTVHDHAPVEELTSIGGEVIQKCSICGLDLGNPRAFSDSDLDYSKSLFGCGGSDFPATYDSGKIKITGTNGYGETSKLALPKVNFANYSKVEFSLDSYSNFGYSITDKFYWDPATFVGNKKLTLSFVVSSDQIAVTLTDGETSLNTTINDSDIINGKKSFEIWSRFGEPTNYIIISLPTLTNK